MEYSLGTLRENYLLTQFGFTERDKKDWAEAATDWGDLEDVSFSLGPTSTIPAPRGRGQGQKRMGLYPRKDWLWYGED